MWRPVVEGLATISEMRTLGIEDVMEFNAAIDIMIEKKEAASKRKR